MLTHQSSDQQTLKIPAECPDVEDQEDDEEDGVSRHLQCLPLRRVRTSDL